MKTTSYSEGTHWSPREGTVSAFDFSDGPRRTSVARPKRRLTAESSSLYATRFEFARWLESLDLIASPAVMAGEVSEAENFYFDWVDPDSLEALAPLSSQDVVLHFEGEVASGEFAPVEVDDLDLEIFN